MRKINALGRTSENAMTIYEGLFDKPTISIEEALKQEVPAKVIIHIELFQIIWYVNVVLT